MRKGLTIFVPKGATRCELLFDYSVPHHVQKERAKALQHEGWSTGGTVEVWTAGGAFGEPSTIIYRVPPLKPSTPPEPATKQNPQKKKLLA